MKKIIITCVGIIICSASFGQIKLGINGNLFLPVGTTSDDFKSALGAGLTAKYVFDGTVGIGVLANYNILSLRYGNVTGQTFTFSNYGGSLEYYFSKSSVSPYIGADVAYYNFSQNINFQQGGSISNKTTNSGIGFAPNIGFVYEINEYVATNVNFKYHHILSTGYATQFVNITGGLIFTVGR